MTMTRFLWGHGFDLTPVNLQSTTSISKLLRVYTSLRCDNMHVFRLCRQLVFLGNLLDPLIMKEEVEENFQACLPESTCGRCLSVPMCLVVAVSPP